MEKSIGIVICNYNKADYVVNCIQSVLDSTIQDFDIYVVDNASTDLSVEKIREAYSNQVTLIVNQENLGGSGGFNTGLREVLKHEYQYIMCVDNDVAFDAKAIETLRDFLEKHEDVGMVGSKIFYMDDPKRIWSYGGELDFDQYIQRDHYRGLSETPDMPESDYVDYVPACSLMMRTEAVRKVGIMPEDNFIYWDDMEWGYRFNCKGYRVAVCGNSKVWHKGGGSKTGNTFTYYYMWRNRIHFFLSILPTKNESKQEEFQQSVCRPYNPLSCKEQFAKVILEEMFRMIYSVNLKGETNIVKTLMFAFDDAVHGVRNKAKDGRILERFKVPSRLHAALAECKNVLIRFNGNFDALSNIVRNIVGFNEKLEITISVSDLATRQTVETQYPSCKVTEEYLPQKYDRHLVMCEHIFKLPESAPEDVYIDLWCNIIYSADDYVYCKSFEQTKELFLLCKNCLLLD